jgi:hypothetical protein
MGAVKTKQALMQINLRGPKLGHGHEVGQMHIAAELGTVMKQDKHTCQLWSLAMVVKWDEHT